MTTIPPPWTRACWILALTAVWPTAAIAHADFGAAGADSGWATGFTHPLRGPDHILAMVSVGIISARIGGRAIWTVPLAFVVAMAVGGAIGSGLGGTQATTPWVEFGIALSVVALGAAIAIGSELDPLVAMAFVGLFGLCHGYGHGAEIPVGATLWPYLTGIVAATAGLHLAGVGIGIGAARFGHGVAALRLGGAAVAVIGLGPLLTYYGP